MIAEYISAGAALCTVLLTAINMRKIREVHVLVNNQLDAVMTKLSESQAREQALKDKAPE